MSLKQLIRRTDQFRDLYPQPYVRIIEGWESPRRELSLVILAEAWVGSVIAGSLTDLTRDELAYLAQYDGTIGKAILYRTDIQDISGAKSERRDAENSIVELEASQDVQLLHGAGEERRFILKEIASIIFMKLFLIKGNSPDKQALLDDYILGHYTHDRYRKVLRLARRLKIDERAIDLLRLFSKYGREVKKRTE